MTKTKTKINRFLSWAGLTLLRTVIVILGYSIEAMMYLFEFILWLLFRVGKPLGINICYFTEEEPEGQEMDFTEKYTKDAIEDMAKKINADATIKQIEGELGVSYRQARKIKEAARHAISINHYSWEDKLV